MITPQEPKRESRKFLQFPLCLLASGTCNEEKLDYILGFASINAGLQAESEAGGPAEAIGLIEQWGTHPPEGFDSDHAGQRAWTLGRHIVGHYFTKWEAAVREFNSAKAFIDKWPGKTPLVRVMTDVFTDVVEKRFDFRDFAVLCAVYSIIGNKPYCIVRRDRVRAGALGYSSAKALFDADGKLTRDGAFTLKQRADKAQPLTVSQVRTTLDKMNDKHFVSRVIVRNRTAYYSRSLDHAALGDAVFNRVARQISGSTAQKAAQSVLNDRISALLKR